MFRWGAEHKDAFATSIFYRNFDIYLDFSKIEKSETG
jgi:hypothetical protein